MVLNSFTFPFQAITDYRDKFALLERTKETLTRLCASLALSVRKPFNSALSRPSQLAVCFRSRSYQKEGLALRIARLDGRVVSRQRLAGTEF